MGQAVIGAGAGRVPIADSVVAPSIAVVRDQVASTTQCVFCGIVAGTVPCAKVAEDATCT